MLCVRDSMTLFMLSIIPRVMTVCVGGRAVPTLPDTGGVGLCTSPKNVRRPTAPVTAQPLQFDGGERHEPDLRTVPFNHRVTRARRTPCAPHVPRPGRTRVPRPVRCDAVWLVRASHLRRSATPLRSCASRFITCEARRCYHTTPRHAYAPLRTALARHDCCRYSFLRTKLHVEREAASLAAAASAAARNDVAWNIFLSDLGGKRGGAGLGVARLMRDACGEVVFPFEPPLRLNAVSPLHGRMNGISGGGATTGGGTSSVERRASSSAVAAIATAITESRRIISGRRGEQASQVEGAAAPDGDGGRGGGSSTYGAGVEGRTDAGSDGGGGRPALQRSTSSVTALAVVAAGTSAAAASMSSDAAAAAAAVTASARTHDDAGAVGRGLASIGTPRLAAVAATTSAASTPDRRGGHSSTAPSQRGTPSRTNRSASDAGDVDSAWRLDEGSAARSEQPSIVVSIFKRCWCPGTIGVSIPPGLSIELPGDTPSGRQLDVLNARLRTLVLHGGIPAAFRPAVWYELSGALCVFVLGARVC